MVADYGSIRTENERRYGTDIGRIGPMLLADRYADRTHFIFELLQNAEDALARRDGWNGKHSVSFELSKDSLRVSHFGIPFTEADVRGICGIGESTKDITSIGRFGIGFKSVYAFTERPEVHSGYENFAIDCFVWPESVPSIRIAQDETTFILPLRNNDTTAPAEISSGLRRLGPRTLLFLREIDEISWSDADGASGLFLRGKPQSFGNHGRKVTVMGEERGAEDVVEETWIIFSREVSTLDGKKAGHIEIGWQLANTGTGGQTVNPIDDSRLIVFFPTIVPTSLGFLLQGPYRTTPSRDNVPASDPWNKLLVQWSATLLVESMHELRKMELLDADALNSLPLDRAKFGMGTMFEPLFEAVRSAFVSQPLLPRFGGGHLPAASAMIARTQELRELFDTGQISRLFQESGEVAWVNEGITQDRTPELRRYLMQELGVAEMTPESILPRLTQDFLKEQSDVWIVRLYEFLNGQPALLRQNRLADVPLIRLEDGNHVTPRVQGQPQAFLPSPIATDFPTVRRSVCGTEAAKALLASLGLTQPDPVDDVIRHILPRYMSSSGATPQIEYAEDIKRILNAFETDSKSRRESLISALRNCPFIATIDTGSSAKRLAKPSEVYISTERLRDLFDGVSGILLVDDALECLRGEDVRELMEACGATRYLQPIATESRLSWQDLREMRQRAGCESYTYELGFMDFTLRGLEALLDSLPALSTERAGNKAKILWDALCDAHDRRGDNAFLGTYRWQYYYPRICTFDASFVRLLNERAWVPDKDGKLQPPAFVLFREKGWKQDPFLLSKIDFRPPIIEALAREAGIEPGLLDLLKKLGVTSEDDLKARLGIEREIEDTHENNAGGLTPDEVVSHPLGNTAGQMSSVQGVTEDIISEPIASGEPDSGPASGEGVSGHGSNGGTAITGSSGHGRTPGSSGGRPFISYIGVHPNNEDADPDGLMHEQRIALEDKAIAMVLRKEPRLKRMPTNNPGFDLIELGLNGQPNRWIEVKAMTGDLTGRPVGLSHVQFEWAREHRNAYWLYVVENASDSAITRILRIQDPAGKAHTFTFDHGWLSVAETADLADPDAPNKTNSE
ncbi:hypothetical protein DMTZ50_0500 [Dehalococcoides mccartyi]|nr:hypothetical protein [Dehalococcoides mccartyi]